MHETTNPTTRGVSAIDVGREQATALAEHLDTGDLSGALDLVRGVHPADLARLIEQLPRDHAAMFTLALPLETGAGVLSELDEEYCAALLAGVPSDRIARLVNELESDDAADVLGQLDPSVRARLLRLLEDGEPVRRLLAYEEDTAGGIMATELVSVPANWTVADATEEVRRNADLVKEIFVIFVTDPAGQLQGFVSTKRLLLSPADAQISAIMRKDVRSVTTEVDQEEAVRIMERYDLVSLAVVDTNHRLLGRITIDDAVDVIRDEAEEDYQRLSGITGDEEHTDSVARITRGRLPWLLLGLIGAAFAGSVIGIYEENIQRASVLAAFIPVVMAMAGNAGIQSSAIIVQGLASGDLWSANVWQRLVKEALVAILNGLALAIVLSVVVVLVFVLGASVFPELITEAEAPARLAATAGLSMFLVVLLAAIIGVTIPLVLDRMGVDPALATGPFITTSNDIIGLVVFFVLASALYLPVL